MVFMWLNLVANLVGIFAFLYLFWKKLKEDYLPDQIFSIAFFSFLGIGIGYLFSLKILSVWWFWSILIFSFLGLLAGITRFKFRFYESFEAFIISILPWFSIILFVDSVENTSLVSFLAFSFVVILMGLYYFLDTHYKNFSWYTSGRVGFAGLVTAGVFFLFRAALALFSIPMLSLAGKFDSVLSAVVGFLMFFLVYNLSRT